MSWASESTEYGLARNAGAGTERYRWLGSKQRAADTPSGIVLMGVRLYNPTTGRFLQVDPVYGGSCNRYEYTCADPVNQTDLNGKALPAFIAAVAAVLSLARAVALACRIGKQFCKRALKYLVDKAKPHLWRAFWWAVGKAKVFSSNERVKRGLDCGWSFYKLISNARVGGWSGKAIAFTAGFIFGAITKWRCMPKGRYS
ncbi:RHS repeat domain-containing protein [Micromonospora marina]|uniref:RHS repeat-associated core domain-containing protein n=1 Tax=Micromonospora marina TaxID=307120 RepID=A0A1C5ANE4_9ACTN|nr:RHS repeat-associated core domain-containing protein [Micromonospora marina]SCF46601.1 RHS repeat-associated core domain-containing protein [Micromonospora marina]